MLLGVAFIYLLWEKKRVEWQASGSDWSGHGDPRW